MSRRGFRQSRRALYVGPNPAFPLRMQNVLAWYRADQVTNNAGAASAIADQSGKGIAGSPTQATGTKQPTINASRAAFNNRPVLTFASANSQELVGPLFTVVAQPITVIIVCSTVAQASSQGLVLVHDAGPNEIFSAAGPNVDFFAGIAVQTTNFVTTSPSIIAGMFNGASSKFYQNASGSPQTPGSPGVVGARKIVLGSTNGANFLNGDLAEVLVIAGDATVDPNWSPLFRYYGSYYGIAGTS
jgi:hypothetical protein